VGAFLLERQDVTLARHPLDAESAESIAVARGPKIAGGNFLGGEFQFVVGELEWE
jgi:hypothetical protein